MSLQFVCSCRCGYRVVVSGGQDRNKAVFTETMTCHPCAELVDVPVSAVMYEKQAPIMPACPRCEARADALTPWTFGESGAICPKCGSDAIERGRQIRSRA